MRIKEFQDLMRKIYYERDSRRGIERTYMWLVEEVGELGRAILKGSSEEASLEAGDVFAWLCSLCNLLGIDLEEAVKKKYPGYCPRCKSIPCRCKEV
ncbi:MAG: nucleotide pyrophosphohydrolase [Thermoprotei archaeon]|nr:MAG: nucleotide pyrophosphohydrolase [Thermoprotei archaeon]RLF25907.1 MAG: nucleotide pyrophosphohydrolase [Thermoprotei archaeon]